LVKKKKVLSFWFLCKIVVKSGDNNDSNEIVKKAGTMKDIEAGDKQKYQIELYFVVTNGMLYIYIMVNSIFLKIYFNYTQIY